MDADALAADPRVKEAAQPPIDGSGRGQDLGRDGSVGVGQARGPRAEEREGVADPLADSLVERAHEERGQGLRREVAVARVGRREDRVHLPDALAEDAGGLHRGADEAMGFRRRLAPRELQEGHARAAREVRRRALGRGGVEIRVGRVTHARPRGCPRGRRTPGPSRPSRRPLGEPSGRAGRWPRGRAARCGTRCPTGSA